MLAAWVLYAPSVRYGFVYYDDVRLLSDRAELYGQPGLLQDMRAIFVTAFPREEPLFLRDLSWAIDSRLFGFGNPVGYHLVNVLLHGLTVALLFGFLLKLTQRYSFSLVTTTAWLLLAVHTEPVAWIMGRKDIMSAFFMLLALWAQTRRLEATNRAAWWLWYFATLALLICGLLSKVSVLSFPLVLWLHAVLLPYVRAERRPDTELPAYGLLAREAVLTVPGFAVSMVIFIWYSATLTQMGILSNAEPRHGFDHWWALLMNDPLALWVYLKQIFLPSSLSVLYTWPALDTTYAGWQVAIATASIVVAIAVGIWLFRRRTDLFFYYATFFILMVPYLNLTYIGFWVADRYVYFAALFPLILVIQLASEALQRPGTTTRIAVFTAAVVVAAVNVFQKLSYQPAWRNAETLWQYHVGLARPSPEAFAVLAAHYYSIAASHQNTPEAELAVRKMAVVVDAGLAQFWRDRRSRPSPQLWNLCFLQSIVQEINGNPQGALASLLVADQLRPQFDSINLNLARLYLRLAETGADASQKNRYARSARDRFAEYIKLAFRGRMPPLEVLQEKARIEAVCKLAAG
jgi:hypothetical protein